MKPGTFAEGSGNSREIPGVFRGREAVNEILRTKNPGIIRQSAPRIGAAVVVDQLSSGRNSVLEIVTPKRKLFRVFDKIKQMRMRSRELMSAVHSECVIPDHPAPRGETDILREDLHFGGVFIADCEPESSRRLENSEDLFDPLPSPAEILVSTLLVVINVVLVPDIERRVRECEINASRWKLGQRLDAVPLDDRVEDIRLDSALHDRPLLVRPAQDGLKQLA